MNAEEKERDKFVEESEKGVEVGRRVSPIVRSIFVGFLYALFGYLSGLIELPFGSSPLGIALLCAADRKVPYIFVGVCLSATARSEDWLIWVCAYAVVVVIRSLTRLTLDIPWSADEDSGERRLSDLMSALFSENICLRMATSCLGAFTVGLYNLVVGGFLYYDLYGAILSMLAAPAAVLLFYGIFRGERRSPRFAYFSSGALAFALVYGARTVAIYGVSLAAFGAMFVTLYVCRRSGIVRGAAVGIISGLAYSPIYAPTFIFAALAAGALWRVSSVFASTVAFAVGMAWGLYVGGIGSVASLMPAILAASLLFAVIDKIFLNADGVPRSKSAEAVTTECRVGYELLGEMRLSATEQRVKNICGTFSEMSEFFRELGDRMKKPLASDVKQICDDSFDACCANCKNKQTCWEENYTSTISAIAAISAQVHKNGRIDERCVPASVKDICERMPDIIDEINHNCALHAKQLMLCDKTEIFALDYEAMSDLLAGTMSLETTEYECDADMSARIGRAMNEEKLEVDSVVAYGGRIKRVALGAASADALRKNGKRIISAAEVASEEKYRDMGIEEREDGSAVMTLFSKRRIRVDYASRSAMSSKERFCGDTVRIFENPEDRFYALISDGMGSGRDAALTSGICAMFLQKMLGVGNRCDASLRMLNGFLRNKGGGSMHECSATVDLMELDLIEGKASFYKSGAAPTYVFRDGSLFKLRSKTVPVGIIRELDAKKISFDVGDGDIIVMVSDGVTQGKDECPWLFELLKKNVESEGIERASEMIVERAVREGGEDDVSVVMIKIAKE